MTKTRFCDICRKKIEGEKWIKMAYSEKGQVKKAAGDICIDCYNKLNKNRLKQ
jgi:hypothetical protein